MSQMKRLENWLPFGHSGSSDNGVPSSSSNNGGAPLLAFEKWAAQPSTLRASHAAELGSSSSKTSQSLTLTARASSRKYVRSMSAPSGYFYSLDCLERCVRSRPPSTPWASHAAGGRIFIFSTSRSLILTTRPYPGSLLQFSMRLCSVACVAADTPFDFARDRLLSACRQCVAVNADKSVRAT